ncbi:ABC transporter G family member 21 isoform X3 [Thrips palmi]|uniref:ABC transporter G family member 21 isoform X3 n=1 Tax=Thrips palmi TaxID=161013 RepID=A0A6P9A6W9_THRPL|nr:ABC transporter G family member 21 isoform X3 [Thrips palmi]
MSCGKTTLLNCLSGRTELDSGCIRLNRERLTKRWKRRICYVLQQDIFFPDLTLRQTLEYAARLRLPESMSRRQKMIYVDHIIDVLDLNACQDTRMGDYTKRGLSGGEKKRANIACELLTNPALMLLDEPTSGLDSHSAYMLMSSLKRYAEKESKTLVVTVHQPSSQIFYMFDKLLLLCNGQTAYFGEVNKVVDFFNNIGLTVTPHYNPADFILECVKGSEEMKEKIVAAAKTVQSYQQESLNDYCALPGHLYQHQCNGRVPMVPHGHTAPSPPCDFSKPSLWTSTPTSNGNLTAPNAVSLTTKCVVSNHNSHNLSNHVYSTIVKDEEGKSLWLDSQSHGSSSVSSTTDDDVRWQWPTGFWTQFKVLSSRNFQESRPRMLSKLYWLQTIGLGLMVGNVYFQLDRKEESLHDIQSWMFFSTNYWMLFALFNALSSFPAEREVVNKERLSGSYRLSAYYLAKMVGELPLTMTLPAVYHIISYPLFGFQSFSVFLTMLGFLLLSTVVAQSAGFFVGAACMDLDVAITISALYTLATQLFGGYLATNIPSWLRWMRYLSMVHYAYQNMQIVEFSGEPIRCAAQSKFEVCSKVNGTIPVDVIMEQQGATLSLWANTLVLLFFLVIFRVLGYVVLRYFRQPK